MGLGPELHGCFTQSGGFFGIRFPVRPFGKGHGIGTSGIGDLLAGGLIASAVITLQSGFPIGVSQSNSQSNLLGNGQRPNIVPGVSDATSGSFADRLASADHPSAAWVNIAAFSAAPAGTWGNAPRLLSDVRSPAIINTDISAAKNVNLGGNRQVQIKIEVFNLFNTTQFALPNRDFSSSAAGTITTLASDPRVMQFALRFKF